MKKHIWSILTLVLLLSMLLAACGGQETTEAPAPEPTEAPVEPEPEEPAEPAEPPRSREL